MQLRAPLTCCEKLINSDHILYLSWEYNEYVLFQLFDRDFNCFRETETSKLLGFAKVGRKQLFLYDHAMQTYEGEVNQKF